MDQALKQRLIGASILIALAIIFVPMLLDEPVVEDGPTSLDIPPRPEAPMHTRRLPAQPEEGGEAVAGRRPSPMDEITALANRRQQPTQDEIDQPPDTTSNSTGIALRPAQNDINTDTASSAGSDTSAGLDDNTDPVASSDSNDRVASRDDSRPVSTSPTSTSSRRGTSASAAADDDEDEKSTIIKNSPPVAANAASSLITPSSDGTATGSGVNATSGLIPDDQWALQVASFGATENASRLARRLRELGYNPNMDTVYRGGTALHRVRVGPFSNRQAAVAAGERISATISDLRPRPVAPKTGDVPAPDSSSAKPAVAATSANNRSKTTTTPTTTSRPPAADRSRDDGLDRFAVQLGSFAGADNADRLQTRVREAGYAAYVERVDRKQGVRYIVKVGPLLSRNDANSTRDRIERELGVKGILVDYL